MKEHIIISNDRTVIVPASVNKIGNQYEHNVNKVTFDCPRYADDEQTIDLSTMKIYINYIRPDKEPLSSLAENVIVDETDPTIIHFDFRITRNVTFAKGVLSCLVCIKSVNSEGIEEHHWNSDIFTKLTVGEGMENEEVISEENSDLITKLLLEVDTTKAEVNGFSDRIDSVDRKVGSLDLLSTEDKSSVVSAVNEVKENHDELKGDLVDLSLPYTPVGELKNQTYMDFRGDIHSHASYECLVIPIEEIYNNKCIVTTNANTVARIAVYFSGEPSSSTLITSESAEYPAEYGTLKVDDYELNIPNGTKYIVINNKTNEGRMIVKTTSTKALVDLLNNKSDKRELGSKVNSLTYYKEKATRTNGTLIMANGSIFNFDEGILATYDLNGETKIKISGYGWSTNNGFCLCLFKDDKGYVISTILKDSEAVNDFEVDVPANATKVFVNGKNNYSIPMINAEVFETDFKKCYELVSSNNYEGKNFLCLGDSITALYGWRKFFEAKTNPNRVDCVAVVGAHWCDYNSSTVYNGNPQAVGDEQNVVGNQVQKIINNRSNYLDDYDYIFICAGTNDNTIPSDGITNVMINEAYFENGDIRPLENINRSKLAGATRWVVQKLRELFPTAKIVFTTPINRIDFHMCDRVFDNRKAILTCANAVSVDVCDTTKCGINMYDSTDFGDNLHPNNKGAKKLGEYIANWYISHYVD